MLRYAKLTCSALKYRQADKVCGWCSYKHWTGRSQRARCFCEDFLSTVNIHTWKQSNVNARTSVYVCVCCYFPESCLTPSTRHKKKKTVTVCLLKCTLKRNVSCAVKLSPRGSTGHVVLYVHNCLELGHFSYKYTCYEICLWYPVVLMGRYQKCRL